MNSTPAAETKNHTMSQTLSPSSCRDAVCIFYAVAEVIICVLGIAGNGLVIWIAGIKVKKSVVSTWYLSLAVSDFIFCSTLPFIVVYVVNKDWPFAFFMCKFRYFMLWLNMYSSIFLLVIISVDRCVLLMFPVWARNKRTIRKATVIVVLAWIIAAVCSTPSAVFRDIRHSTYKQQTTCIHKYSYMKNYIATVTCRFVSSFLIPFLIIFICYVLIIRKLFNQRVRYKKPLKIMTVLIFAFLICWLPFHTVLLIKVHKKYVSITIQHFSFILVSANSCLNPFLYAFMGKDVKEQCYAFRSKIENAIKEEEDQNANRGTAVTASGEFN
ncbi:chemokine-like receptor 1 [Pygocentrus nattereri]|uniref:chemokine-like receptor 1 n=1 Tax=Pygocentrus nattereri TaxID=42514 RepID=UPI000EA7253B|nr:chemokine-like receptor 1 [Pygocentrus nattereri]